METDEADAYRRELDLTGNQSNRLVPLFISGSFETRRTSPTTSPTGEWLVEVSLKVETRDGARVLNTFERKSLSLTKAAQAISWELPQSIMQNNLIELQPLDEDQQFAMLNNRADAFARIGAWEQCLALREAAVLVDPDDLALRRQIIKQSVKWLEQVATPIELRAGEARNAAQASGLPADYGDLNSALADVMKSSLAKFHPQWIRCQEHMQFLVYRVRDKDPMLHNLASSVQSISWRLINMSPRQNDRDQIKKEQSDLNRKVNREWGPVMAGSNPAKLREYVAQDVIPNMASPESIPKLRQLIEEIDNKLKQFPGVVYNYSQPIIDNVAEAVFARAARSSFRLGFSEERLHRRP